MELNKSLRQLEEMAGGFAGGHKTGPKTAHFIDDFERVWNQYARKYLIPDVSNYYKFADFLKDINDEKWVIVFQQREVFPQLRGFSDLERNLESYAFRNRYFKFKLQKFRKMFMVADKVPIEKIKEVFFRANATFHVLLLKTHRSTLSRNLEMREVASDYEETFKAISRATGGGVILSNNLAQSLDSISQRKDVYYVLSYRPTDNKSKQGARKIKVKVTGNGRYSVYHTGNYRPAGPESGVGDKFKIDIRDFVFKDGAMNFRLVNYVQRPVNGKNAGVIDVKIIIMGPGSEELVYEKSRTLNAHNLETKLSIGFDFLKPGSYQLLLDVQDRFTRESKLLNQVITVPR
jgi:hypothetical protein